MLIGAGSTGGYSTGANPESNRKCIFSLIHLIRSWLLSTIDTRHSFPHLRNHPYSSKLVKMFWSRWSDQTWTAVFKSCFFQHQLYQIDRYCNQNQNHCNQKTSSASSITKTNHIYITEKNHIVVQGQGHLWATHASDWRTHHRGGGSLSRLQPLLSWFGNFSTFALFINRPRLLHPTTRGCHKQRSQIIIVINFSRLGSVF